jgi:myo-inositol 2-dehydrogenase / D-chiro-inositol 1-dehydrogenase
MNTDPVRLALVGLGRMGRVHAEVLAAVDEVDVVAIADVVPAAVEATRPLMPGAVAYTDIDAALDHPGLDGVVIVTPTVHHPANVSAALDRGLHVLCEKPLALDTAVGRALCARAGELGRILQVGFWRRFAPSWRTAKEAIDAGEIGSPVLLRLCQWDADPPPAQFCDPASSGGLAIDCGVHEYDLAEWFTGRRVKRVTAWAGAIVEPEVGAVGDLDNLVAVLDLGDGVIATVDLSRNCRYGDDVRTEILGSSGALLVDLLPDAVTRIGRSSGVTELAGSRADGGGDGMADGLGRQAQAFAGAIRAGHPLGPDGWASVRATTIGHAVNEAIRTGRTVEVGNAAEVGG